MRTTTEKSFSDFLILRRSHEALQFERLLDEEDGSGLDDLFDLETPDPQLVEEQPKLETLN